MKLPGTLKKKMALIKVNNSSLLGRKVDISITVVSKFVD